MPWRANRTVKLSRCRPLKRPKRRAVPSRLTEHARSLTSVAADFGQGGGMGGVCGKNPCAGAGRAIQAERPLLSDLCSPRNTWPASAPGFLSRCHGLVGRKDSSCEHGTENRTSLPWWTEALGVQFSSYACPSGEPGKDSAQTGVRKGLTRGGTLSLSDPQH